MQPSQLKKGMAVLCFIGFLIFFLFMMADFLGLIGDWITLELVFCEIPMMVLFGIVGLWAWSSSNADLITELELKEMKKKRKR